MLYICNRCVFHIVQGMSLIHLFLAEVYGFMYLFISWFIINHNDRKFKYHTSWKDPGITVSHIEQFSDTYNHIQFHHFCTVLFSGPRCCDRYTKSAHLFREPQTLRWDTNGEIWADPSKQMTCCQQVDRPSLKYSGLTKSETKLLFT